MRLRLDCGGCIFFRYVVEVEVEVEERRMTSSQCGIQRLLRQGPAAPTPAGGRKEEEETMAPVVMDRRRLRGALLLSFYFILNSFLGLKEPGTNSRHFLFSPVAHFSSNIIMIEN